ncbi:MAG: hypothetical protein AAGB25_04995 [Pseudomonadota bacterium]
MTTTQRAVFILSFFCVTSVAMVYLFMQIGLVPYWQGLSGSEIQAWWAGPFRRFSLMMPLVHLGSIITTIAAFILLRRKDFFLWLIALLGLLVCQGFNFGVYGPNFNPALQAGSLEDAAALAAFGDWALYHGVRTAAALVSMVAMIIIFIRARA